MTSISIEESTVAQRKKSGLVLPITSLVLATLALIVPLIVIYPMAYSFEGDTAAYGIYAFGVATAAWLICLALGVPALVVAIVALALRRRLIGLPIAAIALALFAGIVGPAAYIFLALSVDAY
ncbi:hypothetical protein [Salinibacterium sp. SWN1162]|uniref:hypothetical protein n=1 Tax=Salinibacterium sp. SWN1162 TaxID=2792053 RepID=UPI0018CDA50E|nr:hypothetical protein [Salinibacterium sp. SWN1162]MBH0009549.1 hypothetical protein [Salinibacterium sp. SWN1162]